MRRIIVAAVGVLALCGSTATAGDGPDWRGSKSGGDWGGPPAVGPGWGDRWVGRPGLDAGYDRWRRDAERAYRRGDFHVQGFKSRPYPYPRPYPRPHWDRYPRPRPDPWCGTPAPLPCWPRW